MWHTFYLQILLYHLNFDFTGNIFHHYPLDTRITNIFYSSKFNILMVLVLQFITYEKVKKATP